MKKNLCPLIGMLAAASLMISIIAGCSSSDNNNSLPQITQTAAADGTHITISARHDATIEYSIDDPDKFITYLGDIRLRSGIKHIIYAKYVLPDGEESEVVKLTLPGLELGTWDTSFSSNTGGYNVNGNDDFSWPIIPAPFMFNQIVSVPPPASGIGTAWITQDPPHLPGDISTIQSTVSPVNQIFFPCIPSENGAMGSKSDWSMYYASSSDKKIYMNQALWAIDEYGNVYEANMGSDDAYNTSPFYMYKILINGDIFSNIDTGGQGGVLICPNDDPSQSITGDSPIQMAASQGIVFIGVLDPNGQYNVYYGSSYSEHSNALCLNYQTYSPAGCTGLAYNSLTAMSGNPYVGFLKNGTLQVCSPALPNGGCVEVSSDAEDLPFTLTHDWNNNLYVAYVASPNSTVAAMKSTDQGQTWTDISPSTTIMHGSGANFVAATTDNAGCLYVAASISDQDNGVCVAQCSSGGWQTLNDGACLPDPSTQQTSMSYDHITGLLFVSYLYGFSNTTADLRIAKVAVPPPYAPTSLDVYPTSLNAQEYGQGSCGTTQNINVYFPQGPVTVSGTNSSLYVIGNNCTQSCSQCTVQVAMEGGSFTANLELSDGYVGTTVPVSFTCTDITCTGIM